MVVCRAAARPAQACWSAAQLRRAVLRGTHQTIRWACPGCRRRASGRCSSSGAQGQLCGQRLQGRRPRSSRGGTGARRVRHKRHMWLPPRLRGGVRSAAGRQQRAFPPPQPAAARGQTAARAALPGGAAKIGSSCSWPLIASRSQGGAQGWPSSRMSHLCCRKPKVLAGGGLAIGFRLPKLVVYFVRGGERSGSRASTLLNGLACTTSPHKLSVAPWAAGAGLHPTPASSTHLRQRRAHPVAPWCVA